VSTKAVTAYDVLIMVNDNMLTLARSGEKGGRPVALAFPGPRIPVFRIPATNRAAIPGNSRDG